MLQYGVQQSFLLCVRVCVVPVKGSNIVSQCVLPISSWAVVVIHSFRKNFPGFLLKVWHTHMLPWHCSLSVPRTYGAGRAVISRAAVIINVLEASSALSLFFLIMTSEGISTLLSLHKIKTCYEGQNKPRGLWSLWTLSRGYVIVLAACELWILMLKVCVGKIPDLFTQENRQQSQAVERAVTVPILMEVVLESKLRWSTKCWSLISFLEHQSFIVAVVGVTVQLLQEHLCQPLLCTESCIKLYYPNCIDVDLSDSIFFYVYPKWQCLSVQYFGLEQCFPTWIYACTWVFWYTEDSHC